MLERDDYLDAARRAAAFLLETMRDGDGRLLRTYNAGQAKLNAYLEDHAFLLEALITLYEATFEARWFHAARATADTIIERFADPERGGFFQTSSDHEQLVARRKELEDNPIPSGASSAAFGLLRLAALTGEARYEQHAAGVLRARRRARAALPAGLRAPPAGAGLPPRDASARSRSSATDTQRARARRARRVSPAPRARRRRRVRRRAGSRCSKDARRWTAARPPTSASASAASSPSSSPTELEALLTRTRLMR